MRKFSGSGSCCSCGNCDQYRQYCGSDFAYNVNSTAIFNQTNQWYYETYTTKNWYTAADANTWVSSDYLGYTRIPESGFNSDYYNDYNTPAGAPTKREWTANDIIGAYNDDFSNNFPNGGFEDGGAFHYDEDEELYYRIYQDSTDQVETEVTMVSYANWNVTDMWWWQLDKNSRRSPLKATADNHAVDCVANGQIDMVDYITEYTLTGNTTPLSGYARISDGVWDLPSQPTTMDDWDTATSGLDFSNGLVTGGIDDITDNISGYGSGVQEGTNITVFFGLNDPTLSSENRPYQFSNMEIEFQSGTDDFDNIGDFNIDEEWYPVNDVPQFGNPYNSIAGENLDVPLHGLTMTIPKAIGLDNSMLICTQDTSMVYSDLGITRNLLIELLDQSLAETDPNYVFKSINIDARPATVDGTVKQVFYATMDDKVFSMFEGNAIGFDPKWIRLRYSDGLIGLTTIEEGGVEYAFDNTPNYTGTSSYPKFCFSDPCYGTVDGWHQMTGEWAEWIEDGVSYPSSIKIRLSHPNGDKVDTFNGWSTTKVNTKDCQDIGCSILDKNRTLITRTAIDSLNVCRTVGVLTNTPTYYYVNLSNLQAGEGDARTDNLKHYDLDLSPIDPDQSSINSSSPYVCFQRLSGTAPTGDWTQDGDDSPFWHFQIELMGGTETDATVRAYASPYAAGTGLESNCDGTLFPVSQPVSSDDPILVFEKQNVDLTLPVSFTMSDLIADRKGRIEYGPSLVCDNNSPYLWNIEFTTVVKSSMPECGTPIQPVGYCQDSTTGEVTNGVEQANCTGNWSATPFPTGCCEISGSADQSGKNQLECSYAGGTWTEGIACGTGFCMDDSTGQVTAGIEEDECSGTWTATEPTMGCCDISGTEHPDVAEAWCTSQSGTFTAGGCPTPPLGWCINDSTGAITPNVLEADCSGTWSATEPVSGCCTISGTPNPDVAQSWCTSQSGTFVAGDCPAPTFDPCGETFTMAVNSFTCDMDDPSMLLSDPLSASVQFWNQGASAINKTACEDNGVTTTPTFGVGMQITGDLTANPSISYSPLHAEYNSGNQTWSVWIDILWTFSGSNRTVNMRRDGIVNLDSCPTVNLSGTFNNITGNYVQFGGGQTFTTADIVGSFNITLTCE